MYDPDNRNPSMHGCVVASGFRKYRPTWSSGRRQHRFQQNLTKHDLKTVYNSFMEGVGVYYGLNYDEADFIHCSRSITAQMCSFYVIFPFWWSGFCCSCVTNWGSWSVSWWKMMAKHICWAVFRVVLSAWRCVPPSLSFRTATLWAFQPPLSGPPSLPKPSYSLLFLCLVFCLRPSLIRYVGSNFPIYKHLKYLSLWLFLHCCLKEMQNRIQH